MENSNDIPTLPATPPAPLYNNFLETGRSGKNEWWRYLVGIIIVIAAYFIGQIPFTIYAAKCAIEHGHSKAEILLDNSKLLDPSYTHVNLNTQLALECLMFFFAMVGLFIAVRYIHKKHFISIITSAKKIRYKRLIVGFIIWGIANGIMLFISLRASPENYHLIFKPELFYGTLIICVLMLPIQTWWEEFFVRGYLLQSFGLIFKRGLPAALVTAIIFGLLHLANKEVDCYGVPTMLPQYILPGILFGLIAVLDEGLEIAMGLHLSNNLFGILTVTNSCMSVQANAIWRTDSLMDEGSGIFSQIIVYAVILAILWFIYKWKLSKLYR
jgi:membrane protease YdiL (CAAX protease family)